MNYPSQEWLEGLKVGDEVAVKFGWSTSGNVSLGVISSITACYIRVTCGRQTYQFRRRDGAMTGDSSGTIMDRNDEFVKVSLAVQECSDLYFNLRTIPSCFAEEFNEFARPFLAKIREWRRIKAMQDEA